MCCANMMKVVKWCLGANYLKNTLLEAQDQSYLLCSSSAWDIFRSLLLCPWRCAAFSCPLSLHVQLSGGMGALVVCTCKDNICSQHRCPRSGVSILACPGQPWLRSVPPLWTINYMATHLYKAVLGAMIRGLFTRLNYKEILSSDKIEW